MTLLRDKLTSFRRFVANSYTDAEKQDAINLFLGNFVPLHGLPPLWALDSDYYLHVLFSEPVCHTFKVSRQGQTQLQVSLAYMMLHQLCCIEYLLLLLKMNNSTNGPANLDARWLQQG